MPEAAGKGLVVLVGAGPGDEGLLTLAGQRWLSAADTVIYDRLAAPAMLRHCRPEAEKIYVGKSPGRERWEQPAINELLVRHGRAGKLVVRLKGGDPFIFGRGGEEAEALVAAGVPYRVVPGITAAIAAGAGAGIPLTDRRLASSVALVTGQEDPAKETSGINWRALAGIDTVVFYMGVRNLRGIVAALLEAGRQGDTPAAIVALGGTPRQRTILATLATLPAAAESAGIEPPALTIVGEVARLHERLAWFEKLPLHGQTVLVTRTRRQGSDLSQALAEMGAAVIEAPTIDIRPVEDFVAVDAALRQLERFDIVAFTSANGAEAFIARCRQLGLDGRRLGRAKVAAVGPATAEALRRNFIEPDFLPAAFTTEALAEAVIAGAAERSGMGGPPAPTQAVSAPPPTGKMPVPHLSGKRVLLARADIATDTLAALLRSAGALVEEVAFYRTLRPLALPGEALALLNEGRVNWVTFASSSAVENFLALLPPEKGTAILRGVKLAAIGPVTAETLRRRGLSPAVVAEEYTIPGLIRAMLAAAE